MNTDSKHTGGGDSAGKDKKKGKEKAGLLSENLELPKSTTHRSLYQLTNMRY